jgi:hypothetical protein
VLSLNCSPFAELSLIFCRLPMARAMRQSRTIMVRAPDKLSNVIAVATDMEVTSTDLVA